jgi:hypothetical protein
MKRNASMIAAFTVLLAVFGVSNLPKKATESEPTSISLKNGKSSLTPNKGKATSFAPCDEIRKRLQPFVGASPFENWVLPDRCYGDDKRPAKKPAVGADLKVIIATAPNPLSTHLPLFFDRLVEVIQQAAQDEDYIYDSSWFPWNTGNDYLFLNDQNEADAEREAVQQQPGVITFRRAISKEPEGAPYSAGLIVFVVAEQPTGGIDALEFENALGWMNDLAVLTRERHLHILGPTFSGSLPSLRKALDSSMLGHFAHQSLIHIFSGTVSSEQGYGWFNDSLRRSGLGTFSTFMEGDDLMGRRFTDYICHQGYDVGRVAMLSEDETAFGTNRESDPKSIPLPEAQPARRSIFDLWTREKKCPATDLKPLFLYYPRDIATLRSAYERQSIFSSAKPQSSGGPATSLRGDLSEPESSDHDTVRSYASQLTPLAQEALLTNIANVLSEHHIEFIILRSTNSLDQIFLSQFLRRAYPQARVVIDGADLLAWRGIEGTSLRGVMLLSTYPLLTLQQDWTLKDYRAYRLFQQDVSEGVYVASRSLIGGIGPNPAVPITNYSRPAWMGDEHDAPRQHPATWLSVVGHHRFWPLAVLTKWPDRAISEPIPVSSDADPKPIWIVSSLKFFLVLSLFMACLHLLWCSRATIAPTPSLKVLGYFAPIPRKQHPVLIATCSVLFAWLVMATAAATGLLRWSLADWRGALLTCWTVLVLCLSLAACVKNYQLPMTCAYGFPSEVRIAWHRKTGSIALIAFALICLLYVHLVGSPSVGPANAVPAYWRSAHLFSGVSPLTPQILLLIGLYLWVWFQLRGLALFGDDRPMLPLEADLPPSGRIIPESSLPMFSQEGAAEPVENAAIPLGRKYVWRLILFFIPVTLAVVIFANEDVMIRTLGERSFGILMFVWVSFCLALILADTAQLVLTWTSLSLLLVYLDRLPLRRTLLALRGMSWGSVWTMSGDTLKERYRVISRQFESLRHLKNCLGSLDPGDCSPRDASLELNHRAQVLDSVERCQKRGQAFASWYVSMIKVPNPNIAPLHAFQEEIAATAASVLKHVLIPAWQEEKESLIFDRERVQERKKEENGIVLPVAKNVPEHVLAAEEFFVLPYVGFIQNTLGRIRTIVLSSLFLFVATTLAVSSYPFDPLPVLGGIFLGVFAIAGGAMILVLAQMSRDATLSYITDTNPGELGGHFWVQLITFGVGPFLGLLTTLFPSITDFVSSWLQPSMQALK